MRAGGCLPGGVGVVWCGAQAGKVAGDPSLGRYLADTLAVVPHFAKADFEKLFNDSVQVRLAPSSLSLCAWLDPPPAAWLAGVGRPLQVACSAGVAGPFIRVKHTYAGHL